MQRGGAEGAVASDIQIKDGNKIVILKFMFKSNKVLISCFVFVYIFKVSPFLIVFLDIMPYT